MFSGAIDAAFSAFGVPATYTGPTPGALPVDLVAILRLEDKELNFALGSGVARTAGIEVRAADFPDSPPEVKGRIDVGDRHWIVSNEPEQNDPDRLTWLLRCRPYE